MLELHQAQGQAFAQARAVWTKHGLTSAEFDVLATLRNAPPPHELTPSQLQESVLITSGGLTKVMRQLEARKLVARSQQEIDQRVKPIKLARPGKRLVEKAMAELVAIFGKQVRAVLAAQEIATLTGLLRKLVAAGNAGAA